MNTHEHTNTYTNTLHKHTHTYARTKRSSLSRFHAHTPPTHVYCDCCRIELVTPVTHELKEQWEVEDMRELSPLPPLSFSPLVFLQAQHELPLFVLTPSRLCACCRVTRCGFDVLFLSNALLPLVVLVCSGGGAGGLAALMASRHHQRLAAGATLCCGRGCNTDPKRDMRKCLTIRVSRPLSLAHTSTVFF